MRGSNSQQIQFPSPHPSNQQIYPLQQKPNKQQQQQQKQQTYISQSNSSMFNQNKAPQHPFLIKNYDQPSFSGYNKRANFLSRGKRKCSQDSMFHPLTKQHITEERITSSMRRLSLEFNMNSPVQVNRTIDEGFYEEVNLVTSDEFETDQSDTENVAVSKMKQVYLTPGIRESLKKFDEDILPRQFLDDMQRNALALVPYKPSPLANFPSSALLKDNNTDDNEEVVANLRKKERVKLVMDVDE